MSRHDDQNQYYGYGYGAGAPQQGYSGQPNMRDRNYGSYVPPTEEPYMRHDMAVQQYDDRHRYDEGRRSSRGRYSDDDYDSRHDDHDRGHRDRRSRSRHSRKTRSRSKSRASSRIREYGDRAKEKVSSPQAKEFGATALGAVVGAIAARELGNKSGVATAVGAIAGGWGAHALEQRHEEKKEHKKDSRHDDDDRYDREPRRRSVGRYDNEESGYESKRRSSRSRRDRYD